MATVNLINSSDIEITQNNDDIALHLSNDKQSEIDNKVLGGSGYTKFSDGTLICYGKTSSVNINANSEVEIDINLPQSYVDTNYQVLADINSGGTNWAGGLAVKCTPNLVNKAKIIAGNYISNSQISNIVFNYITIGKWK